MKSFSRDTPSFATFSAISAALHQKVCYRTSEVIVSGAMIVSRGLSRAGRRHFSTEQIHHSCFHCPVFLSRFSASVVRCPTTEEEHVLLGFGVERPPVEASPGRDHREPGARHDAGDFIG